jgi:DoxX.
MIYNFLFSSEPRDTKNSVLLLVARIIFGSLLLYHGIQKLGSFSELSSSFPDPLGVGSQLSLSLAIFGELVCSLGFIFGLLYRLAMIPMIFTMGIVFFCISQTRSFCY